MRMELQAAIVLVLILGFVGVLFNTYSKQREQQLIERLNETCITITNNLGDYLNESANITCDCYYENVNTGVPQLDNSTVPFCTCDCLRNGVHTKIAVRSYASK